MRITVIGANYSPEPTGIAPYTAAAVEYLHARGHLVRVITGYPHYPQWRVDERYGGQAIDERINGVEVHRVRHSVPSTMSAARRARFELSFGRAVVTSAAFRAARTSDVVVVVSPALLANAVIVPALRLGARRPAIGVWVQDLYTQGVQETGIAGQRIVARVESTVIRQADGVAVLHPRFASALEAIGVDGSRISLLPNWTHIPVDRRRGDRGAARRALGWRDGEVVVLHAGNMGVKQHLDNVVEAGRLAQTTGVDVRFVLMGDGNQRARLEQGASGVGTVQFVDPLPEREYVAALGAADILLVNEAADISDMAVPSKLTSYFISGTPVVAATREYSLTHDELVRSGAGLRVDPGDPAALLEAVTELAADPIRAAEMTRRGSAYARSTLAADTALARVEDWATSLVGRDQRR
ncbi:glycosyltransferase [Williamsia deligens]|uniref:Glycosyltransferase n=1 Tax=Williamsia deligens TaxID=321325 RepID=A0ABW3G7N0_9NOCA|nr:glycosyltransferase [Williamsia deligens]MCP2194516.1 Glycosyltransferase involved in cell wall bisynthesis [Williamsia deligens]